MEHEDIILTEISQIEKKVCMISQVESENIVLIETEYNGSCQGPGVEKFVIQHLLA